MVEVIWTKKAFGQLERTVAFIREEQGVSYAGIVLTELLRATKRLASNPELGVKEPLLAYKKSEYRFLVVWSYKIIYRIGKDKVVISRLFHTSRNPSKLKGI